MIGTLTYQEMIEFANKLSTSSINIREIINKYDFDNLNKVLEFCDAIDSYSRFLASSVELYKDSDAALQTMIEKNK